MRFYSKLTAAFWISGSSTLVWIYLGFFSPRHSIIQTTTAIVFLLLSLLTVAAYASSSCTLSPDGLHEHRLWANRVIPYDTISSVGPATFKRLRTGVIAGGIQIHFDRAVPAFDLQSDNFERGTMTFFPAHPSKLLTALRDAAPQAVFEKDLAASEI